MLENQKFQFGSKEKIFKRVNLEILKTSNLTNNNIIISGGKSIIGFYKYLNNFKAKIILSDERVVKKNSKMSNYKNIIGYVDNIKRLTWPNEKFYQIKDLKKKIKYSEDIISKKKISMSILTIGEDGHIASIFKKNLKKSLKEKSISSIKNKKEKFYRISVSLKKINSIKKNIIVIIGKKKSLLLKKKNLPFLKVKNSIIFFTY